MAKKKKDLEGYREKQKIDFKYNLKLYFSFVKRYKFLFFFVSLLVVLTEVLRIVDNFLFKAIVDKGTFFAAGTLSKELFVSALVVIMIIFFSVLFVKFFVKWLRIHTLNRLEARLIVDLKRKFFDHLIHLSHGFHTTHKTGSLISRLSRGGRAIEGFTDNIVFNFAPLFIQLIVAGASLIYFDPISALIVVITMSLFIGYSLIIQSIQQEANLQENATEDIEKGNMADFFTNVDSIKYFGKENDIKQKYVNLTENTKKAALRSWDFWKWTDAGQGIILGVGTFLLIYFPMTKFLAGEMTLGTVVFIYTVFGTLMNPLFGFVQGVRSFYRQMADFNSLFEYNKIENDIKDKPDAKKLKIKDGAIEFRNVSFKYGERLLFNRLNLQIQKNRKIALVGHSGSGKTSLVKLLYRFYDVDRGQILIDGQDIRDFKQESLRGELSIVPQDCVLFDDTIYNNIAFANPRASRDEVLRAIKFAQLDKIIKEFPQREETVVGERGVKLSGGEKQRVSIARAILANKKVLILDEATSSLDSETEHEIQNDFERLMEGRTSIIIAHRLSTIMRADTIVVFEHGKIVQMGTHNQLIKQEGQYRRLWHLQKGGYLKD